MEFFSFCLDVVEEFEKYFFLGNGGNGGNTGKAGKAENNRKSRKRGVASEPEASKPVMTLSSADLAVSLTQNHRWGVGAEDDNNDICNNDNDSNNNDKNDNDSGADQRKITSSV